MVPDFRNYYDLEKYYAHHWSDYFTANHKRPITHKGFILDCPNGWSISIQYINNQYTTLCEMSIWQQYPDSKNRQYYVFPSGDSVRSVEIRNIPTWIDRVYEFPSYKTIAVDKFLEKLSGKNRSKTIHNRGCVYCDTPNLKWSNDISRKEYAISGYCQDCQDIVFNPIGEE